MNNDHPCAWHKGDEPIPTYWRCESCGEMFDKKTFSHARHAPNCDGTCKSCPIQCGPVNEELDCPGCQNCGKPYYFKTCDGCGQTFIDWDSQGHDDIFVSPYVTSSGDLFCNRCGPDYDREDEREFYEEML